MPDAKKCKHCGEWLVKTKDSKAQQEKTVAPKSKLGQMLFLGFLFFLGITFFRSYQETIAEQQAARDKITETSQLASNSLNHAIEAIDAENAKENERDIPVHYTVATQSEKRCSVTYSNSEGGTEQHEFSESWTKEFTIKRGEVLYLAAQSLDESGIVIARIYVDGKRVRESESKGSYAIATCDYRVPKK